MIKLESFISDTQKTHVFIIRIPIADLIELDLDPEELQLLAMASKPGANPTVILKGLLMVSKKLTEKENNNG